MKTLNKGKIRALLGVLIVFVVPLIVVSIVYLSKKPNRYILPQLSEASLIEDSLRVNSVANNQVNFADFGNDIKLIFYSDSTSYFDKKEMLIPLFTETKSYPKPNFKDKYPVVRFIAVLSSTNNSLQLMDDESWYGIAQKQFHDQELMSYLKDGESILLLDRNNSLRGNYKFSKESIAQMRLDLQNLLAETFQLNSKASRIHNF